MRKTKTLRHRSAWAVLLGGGWLFQAGCTGFWIGEIEALFAPSSAANALFVLDSVFFNFLAPLFY